MRKVWYLKLILFFAIGVLGGAGAFAMMAPDTARSLLFRHIEWQSLTADEQQILKPLAGKWATMKFAERERWHAIAERYRQMSPTEQKRIQKRMQRWAAATPAQRHAARSNYKKFKGKGAAEKQEAIAAWQNYAAAQGMLDDASEKAAPAADTPKETLAAGSADTLDNKAPAPAANP